MSGRCPMSLVITDDSTRADLEMAIAHLKAKAEATDDLEKFEAIWADINECLEAWGGRA